MTPAVVAARGAPVVSSPAGNTSVCTALAAVAAEVTATVICVEVTATALVTEVPEHEGEHVSVMPGAAAEARAAKYPAGTVIVITPPAWMPLGGTNTTLTFLIINCPPILSSAFNISGACNKTFPPRA